MSLRQEQYKSLLKTKEFLYSLFSKQTRPQNITKLKRSAGSCLRHFPPLDENGKPLFSDDSFRL